MIKGGIPGSEGTYVLVRDGIKNKKPKVAQKPKADKKGEKAARPPEKKAGEGGR